MISFEIVKEDGMVIIEPSDAPVDRSGLFLNNLNKVI